MSKLNIDQKNIKLLFSDKKADFLIPDYQRPYAWTEDECQTLWDDIFAFAFPNDDESKFNSNEEYFLGPIVTFRNNKDKSEIIDGQQRLTTLMLLLRAFYKHAIVMQDPNSRRIKEMLEQCIWKTNEFGEPDKNQLKIDSEVATDDDKDEFLNILRTGETTQDQKSIYAKNYRFFDKNITDFINKYPTYFSLLPVRILNNCILLPIEADSQDSALQIFSTLNDRGKPLADADIFKSQLYKYYKDKDEKDTFIKRWKNLEELTGKIFKGNGSSSAMDELFTRYMYYERAKTKNARETTTEALRKFYEKDNYVLLKNDYILNNLEVLADFWNSVYSQDEIRFTSRVLKQLFILSHAPNNMWTQLLSVYFMHYKDEKNQLDEEKLYNFLKKAIAFIWQYAIIRPGVNALRTPLFAEMSDIVNSAENGFKNFRVDESQIKTAMYNFTFVNNRYITRSMLTWYMFEANENQQIPDINQVFDIEHIYARRRTEVSPLNNPRSLEYLGNKSLLERKINIRASDFRFEDKKKLYLGSENKDGTMVEDLKTLAHQSDFTEQDIESRNDKIINSFIEYLRREDLLAR